MLALAPWRQYRAMASGLQRDPAHLLPRWGPQHNCCRIGVVASQNHIRTQTARRSDRVGCNEGLGGSGAAYISPLAQDQMKGRRLEAGSGGRWLTTIAGTSEVIMLRRVKRMREEVRHSSLQRRPLAVKQSGPREKKPLPLMAGKHAGSGATAEGQLGSAAPSRRPAAALAVRPTVAILPNSVSSSISGLLGRNSGNVMDAVGDTAGCRATVRLV